MSEQANAPVPVTVKPDTVTTPPMASLVSSLAEAKGLPAEEPRPADATTGGVAVSRAWGSPT